MSVKELESFDSGSNYSFGEKMLAPNFSRSAFDLSHLVTSTYDNDGIVYPLGWIETLPTDDFDLDVKALVRVLPQVVPLYSRKRLYVYAFYSRYSDLWVNFNTFMTKGYDGNTIKKVPVLNAKNVLSRFDATQYGFGNVVCSNSFGNYLGLPVGYDPLLSGASEVSALPFMMALRVYRDYFTNRNYFIDDRILLPDDDSRFRLNDDGELLSAKDAGFSFFFDIGSFYRYDDGSQGAPGFRYDTNVSTETKSAVFGMWCHDYPSDRFTSSLPFPQRGDTPSVSLSGSGSLVIPRGAFGTEFGSSGITIRGYTGVDPTQFVLKPYPLEGTVFHDFSFLAQVDESKPMGRLHAPASDVTLDSVHMNVGSITLNQLRELSIAQTELEKMARTDGSYGDFGFTFFGERSKNAVDFKPVYIGGTYTNIQFTEVLQTSVQYASGSSPLDPPSPVGSPLGSYGGHGIGSLDDRSYLGHVHCDDYGMIMFFACFMPDVYYSQGLDKKWTRLLQSDFMLPERSKLGLVPVLNEELFYSPDDSASYDELKNKYLWAWNNIYDEYRYAPNEIRGSIADPSSENFSPYTQARIFQSLPTWSHSFAEASHVRKDYLAAPSEFTYTAQFLLGINAVRPLPYKPVPASILN